MVVSSLDLLLTATHGLEVILLGWIYINLYVSSSGITALKSNDIEEISNTVSMLLMSSNVDLVNTGIGISPPSISPYQAPNYIHESVWVTNTNKYTRGFFGWSNAYFAEFMLNILDNKNATSILSKVKLTGVNTVCN